MQREFEAYLWDIQKAGMAILEFLAGKRYEEYVESELLRSAVERKFILLGEAIAQMRRHFPEQTAQLSFSGTIIAFCNRIVHEYDKVDSEQVWTIVQESLMPLVAEVTVMLDEWHQG